MLQYYTQVPQWGAQCTYTPRIRESSQWSISAQKTIFFFYLRLKTLTRHPLSGNETIEYCYCKTRPLKILTVCSQDTPEQDTSLVESPFINTDRMFLKICQIPQILNLHQHKCPDLNCFANIMLKKLDF